MHECFEVTKKISDLTREARNCLHLLEENSIGYFYYTMLEILEFLDSSGKLKMIPECKQGAGIYTGNNSDDLPKPKLHKDMKED